MLDSDHPMLPYRSSTLFGSTLLLDKLAWTRCWSFLVVWFIPCEPDRAKPGRMTEPPELPWQGDKQEASPSHTSESRKFSEPAIFVQIQPRSCTDSNLTDLFWA